MKEKEKLNQLKIEYNSIEIPDELDFVVRDAIKNSTKVGIEKNRMSLLRTTAIAATVVFGIFVGGINLSPTLAQSLSEIPIIGSVVNIFTFRDFKVEEKGFEASIKIPNISGLNDDELEQSLNTKFIEEGQKLYDDFIEEMESIKAERGEGHIALNSDYEVKTDNENVLSIIITNLEIMASSSTSYKTYTIDKMNKAVVTLHSLFKDDSYIDIISENIKSQMRQRMSKDENIIYFIDQTDIPDDNFEKIKAEQNFYINEDGKLVILFDEYEYAPGYMGTSEFIIPTEKIENILLGRNLIK